MTSISCVVIGDSDFPKVLGKLGSHTDIALFNRRDNDFIFSFISPLTFPEKLQSLLHGVRLSSVAILVAKAVTPELGEAIVALDEYKIEKGLIILDGLIKEQIEPVVKGTVLEGYSYSEKAYAPVIAALKEMNFELVQGSLRLPLDHFFLTKTIGTVGVGRVERGAVVLHSNLTMLPTGKTVQVKSLQKQDENVKEAGYGVRVGVALKGVSADEIKRGYILTDTPDDFIVSASLQGEFRVNSFFSPGLEADQKVQVTVGLQTETATIAKIEGTPHLRPGETASIAVVFDDEKELVYEAGERFIVSRPELTGLRIVGSGTVQG